MKTRVFVSWSGQRSRRFAQEIALWLPRVIQGAIPWISARDVAKGERWSEQIGKQLSETDVGLICVTPENTAAGWLLFEAGALSKTLGNSKVCPVLLGIRPNDLEGPLSQFQATVFERSDMLDLVRSINNELKEDKVEESILKDAFDKFWPDFERAVAGLADIEIEPQHVPDVIRTFAKYGLPEPKVGSSAYFTEGFESHGVYSTVCAIANRRLYVFGRKNRKLFDKEHADFFANLKAKTDQGFDFRCLFLDPQSPDHVISSAHQDTDFSDQLNKSIAQALRILKSAGLDPDKHFRTYHVQRSIMSITVDDAVLYTPIKQDHDGKAASLTKCGFTVINSHSAFGEEVVADFLSKWERGDKLGTR